VILTGFTRKFTQEIDEMVQRVTGFTCLLLSFTALPSFCANTTSSGSGKSGYIQLMFLFLAALILLLIWELVDFLMKKKGEQKASDSVEAVSMINEEPQEEDPFRALLKEETTNYAVAAAGGQVSEEAEEEKEQSQIAPPQFISEPLPVVEEKKERAKRTVHLDTSEPVVEVKKEAPPPPPKPPEEKKTVKIASKPDVDEEGWRDLMQKASQDEEPPKREMPVLSKARETARQEVLENVEEDDPWKALLKKSKQEDEVVKEEEKPWSVFLKSEKPRKGKESEDEKEEAGEVSIPAAPEESSAVSRVTSRLFAEQDSEIPALRKEEASAASAPPWLAPKKQIALDSQSAPPVITFADEKKDDDISPPFSQSAGASSSLPTLKPMEAERKKAISIGGLKSEPDEKAQPAESRPDDRALPTFKEKRSIDLKADKKKEETGDEKKSSSKETTPLFAKKSQRVISIASPDIREGEGDDMKRAQETSSPKEGKKILSIDGVQKKTRDE